MCSPHFWPKRFCLKPRIRNSVPLGTGGTNRECVHSQQAGLCSECWEQSSGCPCQRVINQPGAPHWTRIPAEKPSKIMSVACERKRSKHMSDVAEHCPCWVSVYSQPLWGHLD